MKSENFIGVDEFFNFSGIGVKKIKLLKKKWNKIFTEKVPLVFDYLRECVFITDKNFVTLYLNKSCEKD